MTVYEIIAQAVGIVAMVFNILSFQQKSPKGVLTFQLVGGFLFSIHFFMLDAIVGCLLNVIAVIRALIYLNREKLHTDRLSWLMGFIILYILSYALTFAVFGKEFTVFNGFIELLPVIGMTVQTISFRLNRVNAIRVYGLVGSSTWLVYNIINVAIGAIVCEVMSLISITVSLLRKPKNP